MTELDRLYAVWQRFASGECGLFEVVVIIEASVDITIEHIPQNTVPALANQLESMLEKEEIDSTKIIRVIHVLRRFSRSSDISIKFLVRCLSSVLDSANDKFKSIFLDTLFEFIEIIIDPRRNWRDQNCKNKSDTTARGNIEEFIHHLVERVRSANSYAAAKKRLILQIYGLLLSSNIAHHRSLLTQELLDVLQADLRRSLDQEDFDGHFELNLRLFERFIFSIHNFKGLQPIPLRECISCFLSILRQSSSNQFLSSVKRIISNSNNGDISTMQMSFLQNGLIAILKSLMDEDIDNIDADMFLSTIERLSSNNENVKAAIMEVWGSWKQLLEPLFWQTKNQKQFISRLLHFCLERTYEGTSFERLRISEIPTLTVTWLLQVDESIRLWLVEKIEELFKFSTANRVLGFEADIVGALLDYLEKAHEGYVPREVVDKVISIISTVSSYAISTENLTKLLKLIHDKHSYGPVLLQCLSEIPMNRSPAQDFFEMYDQGTGLSSDYIQPLLNGFTYFGWFCLDPFPVKVSWRRVLFSFLDKNYCGYELFISDQNALVFAYLSKSSFTTITADLQKTVVDSSWHSISVQLSPASIISGTATCNIYIDGYLICSHKLTVISTDKLKIRIGCGLDMPSQGMPLSNSISGMAGMAFGSIMSKMTKSKSQDFNEDGSVSWCKAESRDRLWGRPRSVHGLLGYQLLLNAVVPENLIQLLSEWGPNSLVQFQSTNSATSDFQIYLRLYYHPKNCDSYSVRNLAPTGRNDACLTGRLRGAPDIRAAVHALSGISVMFPLLEQIKKWPPVSENSQSHPMATFIRLLRKLLNGSDVPLKLIAAENNSFAILGALLQKFPGPLIDGNFLFECQRLLDAFPVSEFPDLVSDIRHYLLFDFRVWCHSDYTTRVSHVQFLSTLIKDSKRFNRSQYGVCFMLDVIRTYCCKSFPLHCSSNRDGGLLSTRSSVSSLDIGILPEDEKQVRGAIFSLVKFYMLKNTNVDEIDALLSFIIVCSVGASMSEVSAASEALTSCIELLRRPGCENLVRIMFEAEKGELLWLLLTLDTSPELHSSILNLFLLLLKSNHVSEEYRGRLRLSSVGGILGILLKSKIAESRKAHSLLIDVVFTCSFTISDKLALVHYIGMHSGLKEKLKTAYHLHEWLSASPEQARQAASIAGWQDTIVRLLEIPATEITTNDEINEELIENVVDSIFHISWNGSVKGRQTHLDKWKASLAALCSIERIVGIEMYVTTGQQLIRKWIEKAIIQIYRETSDSFNCAKNGETLCVLFYNFYFLEANRTKCLEETDLQLLLKLLDAMFVWENSESDGWPELQSIAVAILVFSMKSKRVSVIAEASSQLHRLLVGNSRCSPESAAFVLNGLILLVLSEPDQRIASFIIPVIRDLVDSIPWAASRMPNMPAREGNLMQFQNSFIKYTQSDEIMAFITEVATPAASKFEQSLDNDRMVEISLLLQQASELAIIDSHHRDKQSGEAKLILENTLDAPFKLFLDNEQRRYQKAKRQLVNQHAGSFRSWRRQNRFLAGPRGAWSSSLKETQNSEKLSTVDDKHWRLSNVENSLRMRLKLTQNYNFDPHIEASRARDNRNITIKEIESLPEIEVKPVLEDETDGDEDWNALTPSPSKDRQKEVVKHVEYCQLITLTGEIQGRLEISNLFLYFFDLSEKKEAPPGVDEEIETLSDFKWSLASLKAIYLRRYNLRRTAVEFFMFDQTNYLVNFSSSSALSNIMSAILSSKPTNLQSKPSKSNEKLFQASGITQKWVNREISNFEYLMQLNTYAGRTYNDLSQYPVFPWIIADYTSNKLDLKNPATFRDLSWPVGAMNPSARAYLKEKFDNFEDPTGEMKKFHFGTHYSNAPTVMHYLIRMEPFTTLHIQLQGNKFDIPDRQFHSIEQTWNSLWEAPENGVKELIPEFFYMPEFLENLNKFDLGTMQHTKEVVNDVEIPRWASSPEDFIIQNRQALESDHVSENLHKWIDLIFGYKQRGKDAEESLNVFYHLTYEGAVDLDSIKDETQRHQMEQFINNFGQTPTQLLKTPHPKRKSKEKLRLENIKPYHTLEMAPGKVDKMISELE